MQRTGSILIVESDPTIAELLVELLTDAGYPATKPFAIDALRTCIARSVQPLSTGATARALGAEAAVFGRTH